VPSDSRRGNPEHLLQQIQAEERRRGRGRLKVFLGYAAGVGKTYAMLEAARQRAAEGTDVVVAYVETHGREDTQALLTGLELVGRRAVEYHAARLEDLDLDAVLARHPKLALVDELAHTNAPGSRHPKRCQDVEELLAAGIDVYTTLNVQHIESVNDVVAQITGVVVRETVPDRIVDEADEIELVDLPPDELLQRMAEGKVYVPEQAARAIQRFFRKGNLTALRELTLRSAARRVDEQMRAYMQVQSIAGPWPATERLLVCVSPSPLSERLVRAARRLADELRAEWFALYVEPAGQGGLTESDRDRVARNLQLAEELGAKVATRLADGVAASVIAFARDHNVTKIIVGKPLRTRWRDLLRGSLVDQIARLSGPIDVYLISGLGESSERRTEHRLPQRRQWRPYVASAALVVATTLIGWPIHLAIDPTNLVILYLAAVVIAALQLGRGPAVLASILGVAAFDFFFVPPKLTLAVGDTQYLLTFLGLLVVGLIISTLTAQVRDQVEAGRHREEQTAALYSLSRDLAAAAGLEAVVRVVVEHVSRSLGRTGLVLLPEDGSLAIAGGGADAALDETGAAVATWAYQHGQPAGEGTDTLPSAPMRYLPLTTSRGAIGVLALGPGTDEERFDPSRQRLMGVFASQAALAIERAELAEEAKQVELLRATEQLHSALLNSISHELRTPLASITGVLSTLRHPSTAEEASMPLAESERGELIQVAWEQTGRLNRLVGNLLDMTRLEAGALHITREPCDVQDVIGAVLAEMSEPLQGRAVEVALAPELPLVSADFVLLVHALTNVLDNALKYSPPDTPLAVSALAADGDVEIAVADRGPGIPPAELARVFEKFHRAGNPSGAGGTGLGLSITKGIIEAHGGSVRAANRDGGGAVITVVLPAAPEPGPSPGGET
jgi:two-component system, OmpR family, sensor histidine kinase KdpD